jgi:hypothetical protein
VSCFNCGAAASPEARFCQTCGTPLDADATVAGPHQTVRGTSSGTAAGWLSSSDSVSHGRFAPGALFDNRYRIVGLLGKGGMGEVYRADDLRLGQPVALKFLPESVGSDPVRLAQFHNEVRTARQVSHPGICRVHDIGEVDGHLFLTMELVDGEDLATSLRRIGRFPEDKASDLARQLCAAIAAAHERGVLHRDLKPANIMLDGSGRIRVMDFGLAAIGGVQDVRAGTPAYMAPEQLLGREVTARSDIYALGLVLYELFTGRRAFAATTLNELLELHQSGRITPPTAIVQTIDPAIERAILRCLEPEALRRPSSALAVAAALPGGDPLAAALAAGETPSPEMVAAAGEGTGLNTRGAVALLVSVLVGIVVTYVLALRASPLDRIRPEYSGDVLAQKARDIARQLGYTERPRDEAAKFGWDPTFLDHVKENEKSPPPWQLLIQERPSPLIFWYRRSPEPLIGGEFHHDLLTPGIATEGDPAPITPGMVQMRLDHAGRLLAFEAIPPQLLEPAPATPIPPVDWTLLMKAADLDPASLKPTEPLWNTLAATDARVAWTGTWPGTGRPLRVEAGSMRGRPVAFYLLGSWAKPWRVSSGATGSETAMVIIIFFIAISVVIGAVVLARKNLREGRGDRKGAVTLGCAVSVVLWGLWICEVQATASLGLLGSFLIAVCTTTFYGVLFWVIYLALEPFVRRYWPQTLVSWTTLLNGRFRDPIVGRDLLIGAALGVGTALLLRSTLFLVNDPLWPAHETLAGMRSTTGEILSHLINATRSSLFVFFLLFLLRVLLRRELAAGIVFVLLFSSLNMLNSDQPLIQGATTAVYFCMFAVAVLRWGLTSLTSGVLVADLLLIMPVTTDRSAWFLGQMIFIGLLPMALCIWAFRTSIDRRVRPNLRLAA